MVCYTARLMAVNMRGLAKVPASERAISEQREGTVACVARGPAFLHKFCGVSR